MLAIELLTNPELQPVVATIDDYFQGMYQGDQDRLRRAFHPNAKLCGYREGVFTELGLDEWLNEIAAHPVPFKNGESFEMTIDSIDLTDDIASVKTKDLYMGMKYTDYLNMVKIDEAWKIVNRTFHHD